MSRTCEISGRTTSFGKSRKHNPGKAGGTHGPWSRKAQATNRKWKPNLRMVKISEAGVVKKVKVSMKVYKKLRKNQSVGKTKAKLAS
jgi:ribosomal protein L28